MRYVFFTGMGRSGTKLIGSLMNRIQGVDSRHECIGNREFWLLSWYMESTVYTLPYLRRSLKNLKPEAEATLFIDSNSYLQNCVPELEEVFKPEKVFHLVRNPRKVIRSLYTRRNDLDVHLVPKTTGDVERWMDGDKFYQICWNWSHTTKSLLTQNTELIIFEKLISDYEYFTSKISMPLGLSCSKTTWSNVVSSRVNETRSPLYRKLYAIWKGKTHVPDRLPPFEQWNDQQKQIFDEVCGPVMRECGFE